MDRKTSVLQTLEKRFTRSGLNRWIRNQISFVIALALLAFGLAACSSQPTPKQLARNFTLCG